MPDGLLTRRRFLAASAAGATAIAANALWVEPNRLQITEHVLGTVVPGRTPLRVAQLSDLHLQRVGRHEEKIADAVHGLSPDVLLLTGDVIDRADRLPTLRSFLSLLPLSSATYAILGNWEHWAQLDLQELRRLYDAHGIRLLINETATLEHQGVPVLLTGLDDATGGQINLLGWAPFCPPGSGRYVRGWYQDRFPHLYVSQGLGTSVLPARFGAVPEIACFSWHLRA